MTSCTRLSLFAAAVLLALSIPTVRAADKPVKITKEWTGSVADAKLAKDAPTCITDAKQLEKLWKDWKIADKVPAVDFSKEIVVLATTPGSKLKLSCVLNDSGNLQLIGVATTDFGEGFRYVIGTVSKEGVKSVEGKELPKQ